MTTNQAWEFLARQPKMSLTASTYFNSLPSSGLSLEHRLVREAIQNSVDAHSDEAKNEGFPPVVEFIASQILGEQKENLMEGLGLRQGQSARAAGYGDTCQAAFSQLEEAKSPLNVLVIADYNTKGLTGDWRGSGRDDHFGRLVLAFGEDDKADGVASSGGSFGFGKTVYGKSSELGIVVFYTRIKEGTAPGGVTRRLMAAGIHKPYTHDGQRYTGFSFFGSMVNGEAEPIVDEAADMLAEQCGFDVREKGKEGTSVMIIGCQPDVEKLVEAAELYWWPRLESRDLELVFRSSEGELYPRYRKNPDLAPFLEAMSVLNSGSDKPNSSKLFSFSKKGGLEMGKLACVSLGRDTDLANRVALIRGPGMVVSYEEFGSSGLPKVVGVYKAPPVLEGRLTYAEPPAHDRWDMHSDRLRLKFPDDGQAVVESLLTRISSYTKRFQKLQEPPIPKGGLHAKALARFLRKNIKSFGKLPPGPPDQPERPITLSVREARRFENGHCTDNATIRVALPEDSEYKGVDAVVLVEHQILGDSTQRVVERSSVQLMDEVGAVLSVGKTAQEPIRLNPGETITLLAVAEVDSRLMSRFKVSVEALQLAEEEVQ